MVYIFPDKGMTRFVDNQALQAMLEGNEKAYTARLAEEKKEEDRRKAYKEKIEREAEIRNKKFEREAEYQRIFMVNNMGIYNCDRFYEVKSAKDLEISFEWSVQAKNKPRVDLANLICGSKGNVVVPVAIEEKEGKYILKTQINPKEMNKFVLFFEDGSALCIKEINSSLGKKRKVELDYIADKSTSIQSAKDLKRLLN